MEETPGQANPLPGAGKGQYAPVNGLNLYYETYGPPEAGGTPLVLLHGGLGGVEMFADLLPQLAHERQVIAVELQGHGHTALGERPLSFEAMADDVGALIGHLGLAQADLLGYSLGGGAAWQVAIRHPERVRRLIAVSAPFKRQGWYPEVLAGMSALNAQVAQALAGSPPHAAYMQAASRPEDWPRLVDGVGRLLEQEYDWGDQVAALGMPVLVVAGDADGVRTRHAVEMFERLGGGQRDAGLDGSGMSRARLAILPGTIHYTILASPLLAPIVLAFLNDDGR